MAAADVPRVTTHIIEALKAAIEIAAPKIADRFADWNAKFFGYATRLVLSGRSAHKLAQRALMFGGELVVVCVCDYHGDVRVVECENMIVDKRRNQIAKTRNANIFWIQKNGLIENDAR